jgi:hypothetical protein
MLKRRKCRKKERILEEVDRTTADILDHIDQIGLNIKWNDKSQTETHVMVTATLPEPLRCLRRSNMQMRMLQHKLKHPLQLR